MVQCGRRVWHGRRRARHCRCPRRVAADVCQFCKTNDIKTLFFSLLNTLVSRDRIVCRVIVCSSNRQIRYSIENQETVQV